MRLYPNCYYRKTITSQCDGSCGGHVPSAPGCFHAPYRTKQLSTSLKQDISLMSEDIARHDPFQGRR